MWARQSQDLDPDVNPNLNDYMESLTPAENPNFLSQ